MGLSGAAGGAARALEEILAERFEAQKLRALIAEREQQGQLDRDRFEFTKREREQERADREAEKKATSEGAANAADTERRAWQNIAGVANMPGLDPQQAQREMAFSMRDPKLMMEAMKPPPGPKLRSVTGIGPKGQPINRMVPETEDVEEYRAPTAGPSRERDPIKDYEDKLKLDRLYKQSGSTDPVEEAADTAAEAKRLADALKAHKGLDGAFGVMNARIPTFRQDTADAEALRESLSSLLTLENMGKMKGVLSDSDMKILRQASTSIASTMSPQAARTELQRISDVMSRAGSIRPATSHEGGAAVPAAGPAPSAGARRLRFDKTGKPIP